MEDNEFLAAAISFRQQNDARAGSPTVSVSEMEDEACCADFLAAVNSFQEQNDARSAATTSSSPPTASTDTRAFVDAQIDFIRSNARRVPHRCFTGSHATELAASTKTMWERAFAVIERRTVGQLKLVLTKVESLTTEQRLFAEGSISSIAEQIFAEQGGGYWLGNGDTCFFEEDTAAIAFIVCGADELTKYIKQKGLRDDEQMELAPALKRCLEACGRGIGCNRESISDRRLRGERHAVAEPRIPALEGKNDVKLAAPHEDHTIGDALKYIFWLWSSALDDDEVRKQCAAPQSSHRNRTSASGETKLGLQLREKWMEGKYFNDWVWMDKPHHPGVQREPHC
jgi:hypothetical protein